MALKYSMSRKKLNVELYKLVDKLDSLVDEIDNYSHRKLSSKIYDLWSAAFNLHSDAEDLKDEE